MALKTSSLDYQRNPKHSCIVDPAALAARLFTREEEDGQDPGERNIGQATALSSHTTSKAEDNGPMRIVLVGMNHTTAPVQLRERAALNGPELRAALERLHSLLSSLERPHNGSQESHNEGVILSTCNRLEVYAAIRESDHQVRCSIQRFLADISALPEEFLSPYLYYLDTEQAIKHLLRVAAGLDSMILGEPQILGQVADAYQVALDTGTTGPILSALFQQAIHTGKRARTETAIGRRAISVSHAAISLASQVLGDLHRQRVLLIGAGEMAQSAARGFSSAGIPEFRVISRTYTRAQALAQQFGGQAMAWDEIDQGLIWADIVLTSTSAPHIIIHAEQVRQVMPARKERPLFFIDIAVPRNVDPAVDTIPHVYRYDIDDLRTTIDANLAERRREIPKVEAIVEEEAAAYLTWLRTQAVLPVLKELRLKAEAIAEAELNKALRRMPELGDRERRIITAMSHSIVNKILHEPTVRLRAYASDGEGAASSERYSEALRALFGLDGHAEREFCETR